MSITEHTAPLAKETSALRSPQSPLVIVAQFVLRVLRRWQRTRMINALSQLDERHLRDIGIKRSDIHNLTDRFFHEKVDIDRILASHSPVNHMRRVAAELLRDA